MKKLTQVFRACLCRPISRRVSVAAVALTGALALDPALLMGLPATAATTSGGDCGACPGSLFITSAVEHPNGAVTFPPHRGISHGQPVYYVVTDASDGSVAAAMGVNTSQKLANAANTAGVEKVSINPDGTIVFPATVNFNPSPGSSNPVVAFAAS